MDIPRWYGQLDWSAPCAVAFLDTAKIPLGSGLYAFTSDRAALSPGNVLYLGKADGKVQTLRSRISVYARRFKRRGGRPTRHRGLECLHDYYREHPDRLFVRWAGCVVARDLEGRLLQLFGPPFNWKEEHRFGFGDDERIPDAFLY